jgi:taurine dioxygenase
MQRNHIIKKLSMLGMTEIKGLNLTEPFDVMLLNEIKSLWLNSGGILIFRDQHITSQQQIDFSRQFGTLFGSPEGVPLQDTVSRYLHPDHPEIYRVSNQVDKDGSPTGRARAGTYWHSDVSFRKEPASASILYAKQIPMIGGDTLFANSEAAYEGLSQAMKNLLDPLQAVHDFAIAAASQYAKPLIISDDLVGANKALHPVIRTHPDTGRKSIFVNPGFTSHLDGFEPTESAALLKILFDHITQPQYIFRQIWQENDVIMWDNRIMMHFAISDYGEEPRYLERTTIIGERPV